MANKNQRLSNEDVLEIRERYSTPCGHCGRKPSLREIAELFRVSDVTIFRVVKRQGRFE